MRLPRASLLSSLKTFGRVQQVRAATVSNVRFVQQNRKEDPLDKYRAKLEQKAKEYVISKYIVVQ